MHKLQQSSGFAFYLRLRLESKTGSVPPPAEERSKFRVSACRTSLVCDERLQQSRVTQEVKQVRRTVASDPRAIKTSLGVSSQTQTSMTTSATHMQTHGREAFCCFHKLRGKPQPGSDNREEETAWSFNPETTAHCQYLLVCSINKSLFSINLNTITRIHFGIYNPAKHKYML